MASISRSIPASLPRQRWKHVHLAGAERFVADDTLVLILDVRGTLIALSPDDGALVFTRELSHAPPTNERHSGVGGPAFAADGSILVPIVSADASLSVLELSRNGQSRALTRLGPALPPSAPPVFGGMVQPLRILEGNRWLASWNRDAGAGEEWLVVRSPDGRGWEAKEGLLGAIDGVVTTSRIGADDASIAISGRSADDGTLRWTQSINASGSSLHAELLAGGGLMLVDRAAAGRARLIALSPEDGTRRWTRDLDGDVASILTAPHVHAIVSVSPDGKGALVCLSRETGEILSQSEMKPLQDQPRIPPASTEWPRVISADHTHLVWSTGAELVCGSLAEAGAVVWRMALPQNDLVFGYDTSEMPITPRSSLVIACGRVIAQAPSSFVLYA